MRLPISKVYRAFPELDPFSDAACELFVTHAQRTHTRGQLGVTMLSVGILFGGVFLVIMTLGTIGRTGIRVSPELALIALMGSCIGLGVLVLVVRDRWLRWAIREQITRAGCVRCGYSLLGLGADQGVVTCPECGCANSLSERGLSAESILSDRAGAPET